MAWGPRPRPDLERDAFERVESAAEALARRVTWEQGNRIGLLRVHAITGIVAGVQILAFGGPTQLEHMPGARFAQGMCGLIGGLLLWVSLHRRPRSITGEALGLLVLGLWDLTFVVGLTYARLHSTAFGLGWPWDEPPPGASGYVPPYPIAVYAGMFGLICIHLYTLRTFVKHKAPPAPSVVVEEEGEGR